MSMGLITLLGLKILMECGLIVMHVPHFLMLRYLKLSKYFQVRLLLKYMGGVLVAVVLLGGLL